MSTINDSASHDELVENKYREAKFFLGKMEISNHRLFSRNISIKDEREFKYYLGAFVGALYTIDEFLEEYEFTTLEDWERDDREYNDDTRNQLMYDIFLSHEYGIRHDIVHLKRIKQDNADTTSNDVKTRRTSKVGDQHGHNYVFPEEKSGNGILRPPLVDEYRDEYTSGGRVHVPVTKLADDYLYTVVHYCLKEQDILDIPNT